MLRLDQVKLRRLRELVTDAWRMRAPEDLVSDLDRATARRSRARS
jgi:hypothetical protein